MNGRRFSDRSDGDEDEKDPTAERIWLGTRIEPEILRSKPDHTGRAEAPTGSSRLGEDPPPRPLTRLRQEVDHTVGLLMGRITHGGTTRVGQAVTASLTGADFPECTAAIKAPGSPAAPC